MKRGRKSVGELSVVAVTGARLEPPPGMTQEQTDEWHAIVDSLPADYFRPGDAPLLAAFCVAAVFHRRAAADIEKRGMTLMSDKGTEYVNPSHQLLTSQASVLAQLAQKLRLCPSARLTGKAAGRKADGAPRAAEPWAD